MSPDTGIVENPRAVPGGNQPPSPIDAFKTRVDTLVSAANAWLTALLQPAEQNKPPVRKITTEDQAAKCTDFIEQLRKEWKAADDARKAENKPHDEAIEANNAAFRPLLATLKTAGDLLKPLQSEWLVEVERRQNEERLRAAREAEATRKAAEEAARKAAAAATVQDVVAAEEAARKAAEAEKVAEAAQKAKPQVKGDFGSRATALKSYWSANITDWSLAVAHYADNPRVREVVQSLANADAKTHKGSLKVPGVEAVEERR